MLLPLGVNAAGGDASHDGGTSPRLLFQVKFSAGVNDPRDELILYSDDGVSFGEFALPSGFNMPGYGLTAGGGKLFLQDYGSGTYPTYLSVDGGATWTIRGTGAAQGRLTYDQNTGKIYTAYGTQIKVSADDALTFSNFANVVPNAASGQINHFSTITTDGSTLIICARSSSTKYAYIFTAPLNTPSPTWTTRWTSPTAATISGFGKLQYIPQRGKYIAIGGAGFSSSTDGLSWSAQYNQTAASLIVQSNLAFGNGVLVGAWGVNVVITSDDFATHTKYTPFGTTGIAIYGIIFAFGKFYALVFNNQNAAARSANIYSSTNAISWTLVHTIAVNDASMLIVQHAFSVVTG